MQMNLKHTKRVLSRIQAPVRPSSHWAWRAATANIVPVLAAAFTFWAASGAEAFERGIPHPLPSHPGNVFVAGESVDIPAPPGVSGKWEAIDYDGKAAGTGQVGGGRIRLGKLPVGYYEVVCDAGGPLLHAGVLQPLRAPTPLTSPIGVDVAMAWFFPKEKMAGPASLCALARMNRVRDRMSWPELEPKRGQFAASTRYDVWAQIQAEAGLQVLQVAHFSPAWANPQTKRFPLDLRDAYDFYREMARRWRGKVVAFEPWNEADIEMFGGHTGSEMASLQKAAYLGLKAGNPDVIACENVFAIRRPATLADFAANQAWPYFDTFNLHHYEPLNHYPALYADFRAVSAGKPMWVTECSVHVQWSGDEKAKELSDENLRLQSERLTKTFALALHQGAAAVFYFMLPHYSEGRMQYGLLGADLTPRPGYLALAAVGRLLADAKPLGRLPLEGNVGQAYFFDAKPDGIESDVAVVWAREDATLQLPKAPRACYDHLGRRLPVPGKVLKVGTAPIFAVLAPSARPTLRPPPKPARLLPGEPGPIVLQALLPKADVVLEKSAYQLPASHAKVPIFLYNFGKEKMAGTLAVSGPEGWKLTFPPKAEIGPGERKELPLDFSRGGASSPAEGRIRITGDFGAGGKPVLSLAILIGNKNN